MVRLDYQNDKYLCNLELNRNFSTLIKRFLIISNLFLRINLVFDEILSNYQTTCESNFYHFYLVQSDFHLWASPWRRRFSPESRTFAPGWRPRGGAGSAGSTPRSSGQPLASWGIVVCRSPVKSCYCFFFFFFFIVVVVKKVKENVFFWSSQK